MFKFVFAFILAIPAFAGDSIDDKLDSLEDLISSKNAGSIRGEITYPIRNSWVPSIEETESMYSTLLQCFNTIYEKYPNKKHKIKSVILSTQRRDRKIRHTSYWVNTDIFSGIEVYPQVTVSDCVSLIENGAPVRSGGPVFSFLLQNP